MNQDINKVVVVGLDGLDIEKAKRWEPDLLLNQHNELDLSRFDMLKTYHIWPTMFSGEKPEERGFEPKNSEDIPDDRGNWENPVVDFASILVSKVLPHSTRRKIAWRLADLGLDSSVVNDSEQPDRSLFEGDTVFTDLKSRVIEVPAWNKGEMDIKFNRAGAWSEIIKHDRGVEKFVESLNEERAVKRDETLEAMQMPYDIVWTHFHFLDAAQHFLDTNEQKTYYEKAQQVVTEIVEQSDEQTLIIILSDHGLADGDHREPGLIAVNKEGYEPLPEQPSEIREWIEKTLLAETVAANQETLEAMAALGYKEIQAHTASPSN